MLPRISSALSFWILVEKRMNLWEWLTFKKQTLRHMMLLRMQL